MLNIKPVKNEEQASHYFGEADDYYSEGNDAPSSWHGRAARELGLDGPVDSVEFTAMLAGRLPDGTNVGEDKTGKRRHRPGWDVTLSAPKSISVMALAAGDNRLIEAHDAAVKDALNEIENRLAFTRIRRGSDVENVQVDNLAFASFRHSTNRLQNPQLHTHNILLNLAQDKNGQWRSLETREIFRAQKELDNIYKQSLSKRAAELGYDVTRTKDGFELSCVDTETINRFSERLHAIDAELHRQGLTRETATAKQREAATLKTRTAKQSIEREVLRERWSSELETLGVSERYKEVAATTQPVQNIQARAERDAADTVIRASKILAERNARFSHAELWEKTLQEAAGTAADAQDLRAAIDELTDSGELVRRKTQALNPTTYERETVDGYTTRTAIQRERQMLAGEKAGRGAVQALTDEKSARQFIAEQESTSRYPWNDGQRNAAVGLLTTQNQFVAIQGYAGTSKTNSVLRATVAAYREAGYEVKGMAPTSSARDSLKDGAGIEDASTLQSHLARQKHQGANEEDNSKQEVWLVDEASLISARDMRDLITSARDTGARVVLVGDVRQLGSVEAGEAFRQLQEAGIETYKLSEIVRQRDEHTKEAVYDSIRGDIGSAVKNLKHSGKITEAQDKNEAFAAIAGEYASLSRERRDATIVIEPTREGRAELNLIIRDKLQKQGDIDSRNVRITSLEKRDMTREELKSIHSYEEGDIVQAFRNYKSLGLEKGDYAKVIGVDTKNYAIKLQRDDGETVSWRPHVCKKFQVFEQQQLDIAVGDKIVFTAPNHDRKIANGTAATIESIDEKNRIATVRTDNGREHTLNLDEKQDTHIRHGYAITAHAAQGRSCDTVLTRLNPEQLNLVNQRLFYVTVSRARESVSVYTSNPDELVSAIQERAGTQETALENIVERAQDERAVIERRAPEREADEQEHGGGYGLDF